MTTDQPERTEGIAMTTDAVLALPADDFQNLIADNLTDDDQPDLWQTLLDPGVVRRTHAAVIAITQDVQGQLAERAAKMDAFRDECFTRTDGKRAWFEGSSEYRVWRGKALGYLRLATRRLRETKAALPTAPQPRPLRQMDPTKKIRLTSTVFELGWAIREHRERCQAADIISEEHDRDLWNALEAIEVQTDDGPISVAQMVDDIASKPEFSRSVR